MKQFPILLVAIGFPLVQAVRAADIIRPELGAPLMDPSICQGPDGRYWLAATTAWDGEGPVNPAVRHDFYNNRGLRLWVSKDLREWKDLGYVFNITKEENLRGGHDLRSLLLPVPGLAPGDRGRALTAPRISHDGDRFWITHSMSGHGVCLFGKEGAELGGELVDYQNIAEDAASPTGRNDGMVFADTDGKNYLVWGGGMIAPLRDDIEALKEANKTDMSDVGYVRDQRVYLPTQIEGWPVDDGLPEHGAPYGAFLIHDGKQYHFIFSATTFRDGGIHEESYISSSDQPLKGYGKPRLLAPDSGRCTAFKSSDGKVYIAYAGTHPETKGYARLAIAPLGDGTVNDPLVGTKASQPLPKQPTAAEASNPEPMQRPERPDDVPQLVESIEPAFDHPLRHTALSRGPDGTWYLTGTESTDLPDGRRDWSRNKGVRLWKSKGQKNWQDVGFVWEIEKGGDAWSQSEHMDLTIGAWPQIGRAVTAPELHYLKGTFYIAYSMNGQGCGLLRSTSGKSEGPYENLGVMIRHGRDASLFEDEGGAVYLVWGQGFMARLKDDLSGIADSGHKVLLEDHVKYPRQFRRPRMMGQWGSYVTRVTDQTGAKWYLWTYAVRTGRAGNNTIDVYASWSQCLDGPWTAMSMSAPNSEQTTIAADNDGGYWCTVSGEDEYSQCPLRPVVSPFGSPRYTRDGQRNVKGFLKFDGVPAPDRDHGGVPYHQAQAMQSTTLDLWCGWPDYIQSTIRDTYIARNDEDGCYYLSGGWWFPETPKSEFFMWRSKDLLHWERLNGLWNPAEDLKDKEWITPEIWEKLFGASATRKTAFIVGETHIKEFDDCWYLITGAGTRMGIIKSMSGKITGPYEALRTCPGPPDAFQDADGSIIHILVEKWWRFKDLAAYEAEISSDSGTIQAAYTHNWIQDCESGLFRFARKYVAYSTQWTGSYDRSFVHAEDMTREFWSRPRVGGIFCGNGNIFRDAKGNWWTSGFLNTNEFAKTGYQNSRLIIYPLFIGWENGALIIEAQAVRGNRAKIERQGVLWQSVRPGSSAE